MFSLYVSCKACDSACALDLRNVSDDVCGQELVSGFALWHYRRPNRKWQTIVVTYNDSSVYFVSSDRLQCFFLCTLVSGLPS